MFPPFQPTWPQSATLPCLEGEEVHIWSFRTSRPSQEVEDLASILNGEELARAKRMRSLEVREQTIVGRAVCRKFLGAYLGEDPEGVLFSQAGMGKPVLQKSPWLHFNLTHSHGIGLLAITKVAEVGVDLERVRLLSNTHFLAERFFSQAESRALNSYQGDELAHVFFQTWTRKEALLKANGSGIGFGLDRVEVSLGYSEIPCIRSIDGCAAQADKWSMIHLEPGAGFMGAAALESKKVLVRTWHWNGEEKLFS